MQALGNQIWLLDELFFFVILHDKIKLLHLNDSIARGSLVLVQTEKKKEKKNFAFATKLKKKLKCLLGLIFLLFPD